MLDVPCGTGRLAELLLKNGHRVVGVDISPGMLRVAERRLAVFGDRFTPVVLDALKLNTLGRRFDASISARILQHLPLPEQIQFARAVAGVVDGPIVFTHAFSSPYQRFRRKARGFLGFKFSSHHFITEDELRALHADVGLRQSKRYHLFSPLSEAVIIVAEKA